MKQRIIVLAVLVAMMVMPFTALAQDPAEPGSGGPLIAANGGTSVGALNDLSCAGTDCRAVTAWLTVGFLGVDPELQNIAPGLWDGVLATGWTVSEDNLTYTFDLRDDLVWSDGEPVTGWDYMFAYYAYKNADAFESPYSYTVANIADVQFDEAANQIVVTMVSPACTALGDITKNMVPAHVFGWTPDMGEDFDWESLIDHPFDTNPSVSGGPFVFNSMDSDRVVLTTNTGWADGPVIPEGWLYVTVPDQTVAAERFIAGELNVYDNPQNAKRQEIRDNTNLQYFEYPGNSWDYLALNHANPDNPQDGVVMDEEGNVVLDENGLPTVVEQDPHPLFGDVRVRRAIQMAINLDEIMEKAVLGEGDVMASYDIPTSWARDPNLDPVARDVEGAIALLAEAGWTDTDGDGLIDKDGVTFSFELITNEGNTRRGQIAELVQQHLSEVGIDVQVAAIDFNQLLDIMDAQTFDAIILGWRNAFPNDPDPTGLFTSDGDIVGSGFNFASYINPEVNRLAKEGLNVPGCAAEDRAPIYQQIQKILQDDQAYVFLFTQRGFYAANASIANWSPAANILYNDAQEWMISQ